MSVGSSSIGARADGGLAVLRPDVLERKAIEVTLDELPVFLTVDEAAAVLRIGRTSAYVLCHEWLDSEGRSGLPCVKVGRQLRVPRAALVRMANVAGSAA
jgi:excisionase family DNA binding protein